MTRGFLSRIVKIKDVRSLILTKKETMAILGVREAALAQLERLAGLSTRKTRIGYTAAEVTRMLGAMRSALVRP
jgi:hypothetical protein